MEKAITYHIHQLSQDDSEDAEHWLMEADQIVVSALLAAYRTNTQPAFRLKLLNIIGSHRLPDTLAFFASVLQADDSSLWRAALDSIITINHPNGVAILCAEQARLREEGTQTKGRLEWINEALQQLTESQQ